MEITAETILTVTRSCMLLLLAEGITGQTPPWEASNWLPLDTIPTHYDVMVYPHLTAASFTGHVSINITVTAQKQFIWFHTKNVYISRAEVLTSSQEDIPINSTFVFPDNNFFVIALQQPVAPGQYILKLDYESELAGSTDDFIFDMYIDVYDKKERWVSMLEMPLPGFRDNTFRSTFSVQVVRPSQGYQAFFTTEQVGEIPDSPTLNMTTVTFSMSPLMYADAVYIFVCPYNSLPTRYTDKGLPITFYGSTDKLQFFEFALNIAVGSMNFFDKYFNVPLPITKLDYGSIKHMTYGGITTWGLIVCREPNILYEDRLTSSYHEFTLADIITHETVHQWYGQLVTAETENDYFVTEGIAYYLEFHGMNYMFPHWDVYKYLISYLYAYAMNLDSQLTAFPLEVESNTTIIGDTDLLDNKAPALLRMVENFMGDENFRLGISNCLNEFAYSTMRTRDLWLCMQPYSQNVNLSRTMETWTKQAGVPLVNITRIGNKLILTQTRFLANCSWMFNTSDSPFGFKWDIPLSLVASNGFETEIPVWFKREETTMTINLPSYVQWVKLNRHHVGYYRTNQDWDRLAYVLQHNMGELDAEDRGSLLDDVFKLADAGYVSHKTAIQMSQYMYQEVHYLPWRVFLDNMLYYDAYLLYSPIYADYRDYLASKIQPQITDSIWDFSSSVGVLERFEKHETLLLAACYYGINACLSRVKQMFNMWLSCGTKPPKDIAYIVYNYGIHLSGSYEWYILWEKYLNETDKDDRATFLEALCNKVQDPALILQLIAFGEQEEYFKPNEFLNLLYKLMLNHVAQPLVWNYLRQKLEYLITKLKLNKNQLASVISEISGAFYTELKLKELEEFLNNIPENYLGAKNRISILTEMKNRVDLKNVYVARMTDSLRGTKL